MTEQQYSFLNKISFVICKLTTMLSKILLLLAILSVSFAGNFTIGQNTYLLNGEPIQIISGAFVVVVVVVVVVIFSSAKTTSSFTSLFFNVADMA